MSKPTRYPITCAPVFDAVMRDEGICRKFIERVLGIEVGAIEYHAVEHVVEPSLTAHGVQLDAFIKSTGAVYNIEMQSVAEPTLGRRMRYYQSAMDADLLRKGDPYQLLPESHIIFLCACDPFRQGLPVYTFERACREDAAVQTACGSHWRVLNASAWASEQDEGLRNLLEYVATGDVVGDEFVAELDAMVDDVNGDPERRAQMGGFMTLEYSMAVRAYAAREEGLAEGEVVGAEKAEARYSALVDRLLDDGRLDDLKRATADTSLLHSLYEEYGL